MSNLRPGSGATVDPYNEQELGWQPRFADLETIIDHAWGWEQSKGPVW